MPLLNVATPLRAAAHLDAYARPGSTGLLFTGARGGQLRRNNFRRLWLRALEATGLGDVHFHDLRHTGKTMPSSDGRARKAVDTVYEAASPTPDGPQTAQGA
ncbi:hypothetical protein GCM10010271_56690 [Streptomyces kurssanovii]|nr:hypothetical protein GCM10010271_56690 [Streptomyces kurssanovii]